MSDRRQVTRDACSRLRLARTALVQARHDAKLVGARKLLAKIDTALAATRSAINSADGAARHAELVDSREEA